MFTLKALRFLIAPVLAGAMLLIGTNSAQAVEASEVITVEAPAEALQVAKDVEKSLAATGSAEFTGADGRVHRFTTSADGGFLYDGQAIIAPAVSGAPLAISVSGVACDLKVAAAIALIVALGGAFILAFVAPLAAGTSVALAGVTMSAGAWAELGAVLAAGGAIGAFLEDALC